jgi:hypothetical protein
MWNRIESSSGFFGSICGIGIQSWSKIDDEEEKSVNFILLIVVCYFSLCSFNSNFFNVKIEFIELARRVVRF